MPANTKQTTQASKQDQTQTKQAQTIHSKDKQALTKQQLY